MLRLDLPAQAAPRQALEAWVADLRALCAHVPSFLDGLEAVDADACWRLPQLFCAFCAKSRPGQLCSAGFGTPETH